MYNNPYMQNYPQGLGQQTMTDRIDAQISQLNQMKEQMKNQQPSINQTFQLAPTNNHTIRYANTIGDVEKETVFFDTPFFSKDMSVLWLKKANGDIKSYELTEIIPKDSKDFEIEYLKSQIEELKGMIKNEPNDTNVSNNDTKQSETNTTRNDSTNGTTTKKEQSTGFSKVSRSKKEQ